MPFERVTQPSRRGGTVPPLLFRGCGSATCIAILAIAESAGAQVVAWGVRGFTIQEQEARIVSASIGGNHAIALREDGLVECWGLNTSGQALPPDSLAGIRSIAAGSGHSVAVRADGSVQCWGSNASGQCTPPEGLVDAIMVAAGGSHSLALRKSGVVVGWGLNASGQIEIPTDLASVASITANGDFSVAVTASGSVVCWGDNTYGQCDVPKQAAGVLQASAGGGHVVARLANGQVVCWGLGTSGQCDVPANLPPVAQVAGGGTHTVALDEQGRVHCWGSNAVLQCTVPTSFTAVAGIAAGPSTSLAITSSGKVECWGQSTEPTFDYPGRFRSVVDATGALGGVMGIDARGRLVGWGAIGGTSSLFPIPGDLESVRTISVGPYAAIAVEQSGRIRCWGSNAYGHLDVPAGLPSAIDGAAGQAFCVALLIDGSVVAWGNQSAGLAGPPLGVGVIRELDATGFLAVAVNMEGRARSWNINGIVSDLGPAVAVACGRSHVAILLPGGGVNCVYGSASGECDIPTTIDNASRLATGWSYNSSSPASCTTLVLNDGSFQCFGTSAYCPPQTSRHIVAVAPIRTALGSASAPSGVGLLIPDRDCDANGVRDSLELDGHDCNGNGLHDSCDVAFGLLEDCNGNGLGDECEKATFVSRGSGQRGPIGVNAPVTWQLAGTLPAATGVTLRVRAHGDFSGSLERVELRLGTSSLGTYLAGSADCLDLDWTSINIAPGAFNSEVLPSGELAITAIASIAVDPDRCTDGTWLEFELEYVSAAPADCNANGLLDSCEIADGLATDANGNGVIDACESGLDSCPADLDDSGAVNAVDLGLLLDGWGENTGPADIDRDGRVAASDLALLLASWGACPEQ